ncbi:MAG: DUF5723 family protein [Flavobacteriaceae bacterium]|nr:DUF5723 family protein [Flavobacteriaceae bacterium]
MTHKLCLYLSFIFLFVNSYAQNKQILYGFDQLPQTLLLNPGAEVDYNKHIAVPFSNLHVQVGATNSRITYNNIFASASGLTESVRNVYNQNLSNNDYFLFNQRLEIINAGFRLKNPKYYLSFGMYEEIDAFSLYPKEVTQLFYEGNDKNGDGIPEFEQTTNFNNINYAVEFIGVFHIGITKKINDKLNVGVRFKILSGSLNFNSKKNTANYDLSESNTGFDHNFNNVNMIINSSGFLNNSGKGFGGNLTSNLGGLFFGNRNFGLGLDLGATYHISNEITITASVLDLDYIRYSNEIVSYKFAEKFVLNDDSFYNPTTGNEGRYWEDKLGAFYNLNEIPIDTIQSGYNSYRSPKINTSVKYTFNNKRKANKPVFRDVRCQECLSNGAVLTSELGIHTYTIFRPNKMGWAVTAFYSRELTRYLNTKITYTYDNFSAKNIGFGLSTHFKKFNFYATADNLLNLPKLKDSNYQSFQLGMNFMFE